MRDELLAYLLNDLNPQQRQRIEARIESDPIWRHELERLRSYVDEAHAIDQPVTELGNSESDPTDAPTDLVDRTCLFVKQASAQGAFSPAVLPASLTESQDATSSRSKGWSLLDLAIVASILLVLGTLLLPALRESRDAARRLQCQENLHTLGKALVTFRQRSGGQLPSIQRDENAGMYALKLIESGVISEEQLVELLLCPSSELAEKVHSGKVVMRIPSRRELRRASAAQLKTMLEIMGGSFAYRIGYLDQLGNYRQIKFTGSRLAPMMADKPSYSVVGFKSLHHGGGRENVLYQDQSVGTLTAITPTKKDRHWFLNENGKHAAGINKFDIVMGRSEAVPTGRNIFTSSIRVRRLPPGSRPGYSSDGAR